MQGAQRQSIGWIQSKGQQVPRRSDELEGIWSASRAGLSNLGETSTQTSEEPKSVPPKTCDRKHVAPPLPTGRGGRTPPQDFTHLRKGRLREEAGTTAPPRIGGGNVLPIRGALSSHLRPEPPLDTGEPEGGGAFNVPTPLVGGGPVEWPFETPPRRG